MCTLIKVVKCSICHFHKRRFLNLWYDKMGTRVQCSPADYPFMAIVFYLYKKVFYFSRIKITMMCKGS